MSSVETAGFQVRYVDICGENYLILISQFNHTMIRIKDPEVSLKFYTEVLGMSTIHKDNGHCC